MGHKKDHERLILQVKVQTSCCLINLLYTCLIYLVLCLQPKLTLAVGSIIWDEDGHVVRRAVSSQAGAVVAAIRVLAGGVLPTDLIVTYLTLVFIWKGTYLLHFNIGESGLE